MNPLRIAATSYAQRSVLQGVGFIDRGQIRIALDDSHRSEFGSLQEPPGRYEAISSGVVQIAGKNSKNDIVKNAARLELPV
jgi:hypothetical protein